MKLEHGNPTAMQDMSEQNGRVHAFPPKAKEQG